MDNIGQNFLQGAEFEFAFFEGGKCSLSSAQIHALQKDPLKSDQDWTKLDETAYHTFYHKQKKEAGFSVQDHQ